MTVQAKDHALEPNLRFECKECKQRECKQRIHDTALRFKNHRFVGKIRTMKDFAIATHVAVSPCRLLPPVCPVFWQVKGWQWPQAGIAADASTASSKFFEFLNGSKAFACDTEIHDGPFDILGCVLEVHNEGAILSRSLAIRMRVYLDELLWTISTNAPVHAHDANGTIVIARLEAVASNKDVGVPIPHLMGNDSGNWQLAVIVFFSDSVMERAGHSSGT
jgi:hypothetical protein